MESLESKEKREIKQLGKDFRGMKERFKTNHQRDFKSATELFISKVYAAYQINDIALNETVRKSYHAVHEILEQRIESKSESLKEDIFKFLFVIDPVMEKFMIQCGKLYD